MQKNKIIAVWGSPNSGKTTLSIKIAQELALRKKNVIIVFCDSITPVISTVLPFFEVKDQSLGELLSVAQITQDGILEKCISLKDNKYLAVMSYLHGETERTHAKYSKERIIDFFILLRHLADHIIIDCSSIITKDILSRTALELSDSIIRLTTQDLKAISYFDACLPLLSERKFKVDQHYKVVSNVNGEANKDIMSQNNWDIKHVLPFISEINNQWSEARLFESLMEKKSKAYDHEIKQIVNHLTMTTETLA